MTEEPAAGQAATRERLAKRRKAVGLTQEALAAILGVERSTVVRWERGDREPLPAIRCKLASALCVSVDELDKLLAGGREGPSVQASASGSAATPTVPRQLPAAVAGFTGRARELDALTHTMEQAGVRGPGTVMISAIGGTAGVGKTALALHWAHRVADRFRDGQLYVNLRGFDPSGVPAAPAEAVRGFLTALGVPPERIPSSPDAQAALYRGLVADKRMLIVLDNARDEGQVRPLLPASPASLVLVTSRNQLAGLAADGTRLIGLDVLTRAEAMQLITARLGSARAAAEPDAAGEIAELCAGLPLALTVAAARAAARPRFPLDALAAELRGLAGRLDALDSGDAAVCVRSVFSWSYLQLGTDAARMFRLLSLHPGPDISVPAAASMAGCQMPQARRLLRELARDGLITEHAPGRYAFHDLMRAYAAGQARDIDSKGEQDAAIGRLLDHYLHTAAGASLALNLGLREEDYLGAPGPGVRPEQITSHQQAQAWFEAEHRVLLAAIALACQAGLDRHAWQLPWAIALFLALWGHYQEWAAIERTALAAATRLGDPTGQAVSSRHLAHACLRLGDYHSALSYFEHALALFQQLGDRLGEALVQQGLAAAAERQGRCADAVSHCEQALRLWELLGNKAGQARMLNNAGWNLVQLGNYQRARTLCERALALSAEVGELETQCTAWDSLGFLEHQLGNFGAAIACYQRALDFGRGMGAPVHEADTAAHLGDAHVAAGDLRRAADAWRQALSVLDDLQHPDADGVRAKLAELGGAGADQAGARAVRRPVPG